LYVFCDSNPVNFVDPSGLRDYSQEETSAIMNEIGNQNIFQAAWNHSGGRKYDFKAQDKLDDGVRNDTYTFNGKTMNSDQFGNFAAGYAGYKTGWFVGLEGVFWGGVMYDFLDAKAQNFKDAKFDWDKDSWPDIMAGAYYARYGKMPCSE